ncbi:MetQ/NlpA family lipoprotein [Proteus mirabilis]
MPLHFSGRIFASLLLAGTLLTGCDNNDNNRYAIKVGVINGAEQDVAEVAKKVAKEKYGLDANVFQHRPFLEQDNRSRGYNLVAVGNTFVFPMAGYSTKIKHPQELKPGDTIALPNDPTNLGRALLLLQKEKLITLNPDSGLLPTTLDIIDNTLKLNIMQLEGAQLPRVLNDPQVTVAIISTTYIQQINLSPTKDSIFIEDKSSPYTNIIVTREDNKEAENVRDFIKAYQSPEVATAAETIFKGGAIQGW